MNLIEIATGWYHYINATPAGKKLMDERLKVCNECPHQQEILTVHKCGICHCPLGPLTSNPSTRCKDGRWGPAGE